MTSTKASPVATSEYFTVYEIVTRALLATGRLKTRRSVKPLDYGLDRCDISDLYLEKLPTGWVANVAFDIPLASVPNTIGTPNESPYSSPRWAFFVGAAILCDLLTGSLELPFDTDGTLRGASQGTNDNPELLKMTRPLLNFHATRTLDLNQLFFETNTPCSKPQHWTARSWCSPALSR